MIDLEIKRLPLQDLKPYAHKLRKNANAVERMRTLLRKYGFRIPILALRSGEIIDGHLRVDAARLEGYSDVPAVLCDDWSEVQVKAFRLAVNRSATWATFDLDLVSLELKELKGLDFDLELTGFSSFEIDKMLFERSDAVPEDVEGSGGPRTVAKKGDLWICGLHRVLCADSTSGDAVQMLLNGAKPVLMVTDPPYGVSLDPSWREEAGLGQQRQTGKVANDDRADWTEAYRHFPGDVAYVWHGGVHAGLVASGLVTAGFAIRAQIIWVKQHFAMGRGDYHWKHEPCWYAVREGQSSNWNADRKQCTVWEVPNLNPFGGDRDEEATGHGTQKPLELMRRPIINNSRPGDLIYDPFLGSGTTLIAAEMTERTCFGIEIVPDYVDVVIKRWQKISGQQAVLSGDGRTFHEISADGRQG